MVSYVYPRFIELYAAEAECTHSVEIWWAVRRLVWVVMHDGVEVAELEEAPPAGEAERALFVSILKNVHAQAEGEP